MFLPVVLLVLLAPAYSKPSSVDQYESQAGLASEAENYKPVRVQLAETNLPRFGPIPHQNTQNEPKLTDSSINTRNEINLQRENGNSVDILQDANQEHVLNQRRLLEFELRASEIEDTDDDQQEKLGKKREYQINDREFEDSRKKRDLEEQEINERNKREDLNVELPLNEREADQEGKDRKKRNYIHWLGIGGGTNLYNPPINSFQYHGIPSLSPYSSFTHSYNIPSTQSYQVVFPLFGGQLPIFFPPKPILYNPGYPIHNIPRPERPIRPTPPNETDTPMELPNRFGDPNDIDNIDHPVWGVVGESSEQSGGAAAPARTTMRPTVRPARPTKPPTPPLFHRPSFGDEGQGNVQQNDLTQSVGQTQSSVPRPTQRPQTQPPRTTTVAAGRQLDRCVWAIITCCNPSNEKIRYSCFENAGCEGAFWDRNPCSREVTLEALDAAQQFYESQ